MKTPFDLQDQRSYPHWRQTKLEKRQETAHSLHVAVSNPEALSKKEKQVLLSNCKQTNMSFYSLTNPTATITPTILLKFWEQLGMRRTDVNLCADTHGVSRIEVDPEARYIPYTNKALKWHTDGCYNPQEKPILSFAMHCANSSQTGGTNNYLDTDMLYILIRDENPDYIRALSHPEALTIPANIVDGKTLRPAITVPVLDYRKGLLFRYSERSRNIQWRDDPVLHKALAFIQATLRSSSTPVLQHKMGPGEGVICNNILHNRDGFSDDPQHSRLLYRARFHHRIAQPTSE